MSRLGTLVIVGAGIKIPAQTSLEAIHWIQSASKVFFLLNDAKAVEWLKALHSQTEDLAVFYHEEENRLLVYERMVAHVLATILGGEDVCLVFYGHPNVYVFPTRELLMQGQKHQFPVKVCPGISAEDCLFAELGIDPARTGCQSYDATDFLIKPRQFDTRVAIILWQIGVIGNFSTQAYDSKSGLRILQETLLRYYSPEHLLYVYEAAVTMEAASIIQAIPLQQLEQARVSSISTLYIPPFGEEIIDETMLEKLGISNHYLLGEA
jgi:uncharacterized protein YabN with tetrapyrrole methylase and pyrophosphatase domain